MSEMNIDGAVRTIEELKTLIENTWSCDKAPEKECNLLSSSERACEACIAFMLADSLDAGLHRIKKHLKEIV